MSDKENFNTAQKQQTQIPITRTTGKEIVKKSEKDRLNK
jgi:hypothetical protein